MGKFIKKAIKTIIIVSIVVVSAKTLISSGAVIPAAIIAFAVYKLVKHCKAKIMQL